MYDRQIAGRWITFGSRQSDRILGGLLDRAVTKLSSSGARVVLLTMPYQANLAGQPGLGPDATAKAKVYHSVYDRSRVDHWNRLLRATAARHQKVARVIDLNSFVSAIEKQHRIALIQDDGVHFSTQGANLVAPWLLPRLIHLAPIHS